MKFQTLITIILIITATALFLRWSAKRDAKLMNAMETYEECVLTEYNTTPTAWYLEHDEYPTCNIKG